MSLNPTPQTLLNDLIHKNNLLLVAHAKPDGDTLGATLALSSFLKSKNIPHDLFCADTPPAYFSYLPHIHTFLHDIHTLDLSSYDGIVCLDHGSLKQSQIEQHLNAYTHEHSHITCYNIDHHISNESFGHCNFVVPEASSTCEVLYHIFKTSGVPITQQMATCLMTGIITDTGNFTNSATQQSSLDVASDLVRLGAKIPEISQHTLRNKTIPSLNLWGEVFSRLVINPRYQLAYTVVTQEDFETLGVTPESLDGLVNFLAGLQGVRFVLLLTQTQADIIKGSLRTTDDTLNVSDLAKIWGGGGHTKAAGFTLSGNLIQKNNRWIVI